MTFRHRTLQQAHASYMESVINRRVDVTPAEQLSSTIDFFAGAQVVLEILRSQIDTDPDIYSKLWLEILGYHRQMTEWCNEDRTRN